MTVELDPELQTNTTMRLACVLLLDTSSSMDGEKIAGLNEGIHTLLSEIKKDEKAAQAVDLAIITFGSDVHMAHDFLYVGDWDEPPHLRASGLTAMGEALHATLDALEKRKAEYRENGVLYHRPWVFLLTDGHATDEDRMATAVPRVAKETAAKKLTLFAVGVGSAPDWERLKTMTEDRFVMKLNDRVSNGWNMMFEWLSASVASSSQAEGGQATIQAPGEWQIETTDGG